MGRHTAQKDMIFCAGANIIGCWTVLMEAVSDFGGHFPTPTAQDKGVLGHKKSKLEEKAITTCI